MKREETIEYICANINELRKIDRVRILNMLNQAGVKLHEKSDGVCIKFDDIPFELLSDVYEIIKHYLGNYEGF